MKDYDFKELQPVTTRDNTVYWACWCKYCNMCLISNERAIHNCDEFLNSSVIKRKGEIDGN